MKTEKFSTQSGVGRHFDSQGGVQATSSQSGSGSTVDAQPSSESEKKPEIIAGTDMAGDVRDQFPRWKRILDLTCIALTLPCWLPLMVLVAGWIKVTSRGPVFYRQERVGYRGRCFMMIKFRSMKVNAETQTHEAHFEWLIMADRPMTKLDSSDPRLIAGARTIRAAGLDELAQIFNVVRGEMSLVGPRPCTPHELQRYNPSQQKRVDIPPGITGYWQVSGKNQTTFSEMIAMDLFYGKNMSVWLDLAIILKTVPSIGMRWLRKRIGSLSGSRVHKHWAPQGSTVETQIERVEKV